MNGHGNDRAFTLLEVTIAAVMLVIVSLGLATSMGAAFMADAAARDAAASVHAGQQVLEELAQLDYGDVLACDGDALLTDGGLAVKIASTEVSVGMLMIEVYTCRPSPEHALAELADMTLTQIKALPATRGAQVRLLTYRSGE